MPQSHAQVWIHIVFSTKDRRQLFQDESFRAEMFRMLSHQVKESNCVSASVGGYTDHVHLLVDMNRTITIGKLVENEKTETSKWAKKVDRGTPTFTWQAGYGAFSVSHSLRKTVDDYIRNQAEHHAQFSFQDEYRRLCEKHGIEIDERYVWDWSRQTEKQMVGPLALTQYAERFPSPSDWARQTAGPLAR